MVCPRRRFAAVPLCLSPAGNSAFIGKTALLGGARAGSGGAGVGSRLGGRPEGCGAAGTPRQPGRYSSVPGSSDNAILVVSSWVPARRPLRAPLLRPHFPPSPARQLEAERSSDGPFVRPQGHTCALGAAEDRGKSCC